MDIFLITLEKGVECYLFCPKKEEANFVRDATIRWRDCWNFFLSFYFSPLVIKCCVLLKGKPKLEFLE